MTRVVMGKDKPTGKKNHRPLKAITREIHREERASVFKIGKLLIEAKDQLKHGEWLPYLRGIGWEARLAQMYMAVASLAAKYETISHLDAALTALFALTWVEDSVLPLAIERLKESVARKDNASAQRRTVELSPLASENPALNDIALEGVDEANNQNCYGDPVRSEAMKNLARAIEEANPSTAEELDAVRAKHPLPDPDGAIEDEVDRVVMPEDGADDVVDDEPEPQRLPREQELVDQFKEAIDALLPFAARPSATFAGIVAAHDLDMLANFLKQIAASKRQAAATVVAI